MLNTYLFLAYSIVWLIFVFYAWTISRRQARLKKELEELRAKMGDQPKR